MMGYFANGAEAEFYQQDHCERCVHDTDKGMCPVWEVHYIYNYSPTDGDIHRLLNRLIPREGVYNGQCLMFKESENAGQPKPRSGPGWDGSRADNVGKGAGS